ncbi:hypothetical protein ACLK6Z_001786 [Campylobacter coli]
MTSIDIEILLEHKNELLKYLSHLGDSSVFEKDKCFKALNNRARLLYLYWFNRQ